MTNEPQRQLDMRALELATTALAKIESHEKSCAERWQIVATMMGDVKRGIEGLYRRWWGIAGSIIMGLVAIIGFLLARHGI